MTFPDKRIAGSSYSLIVAAVLGAAGCVAPKGNLGEFTDTDGPDTDTAVSATDSTGDASSATDSTGEPSSTTGSTSDPSSTTGSTSDPSSTTNSTSDPSSGETLGETEGSVCGEPEPDLEASFTLTFDPPLPFEPVFKYASNCTVTSLAAGDTSASIVLDCEDRTATLELGVSLGFAPQFGEGDLLALKYHKSLPFWMNEWFTLREATESLPLLLGGINADSLLPIDDDDSTLFEPVLVNAHEGVCELPTSCDEPMERLAVEFKYDQDVLELVAGTSGLVGNLTSYRAVLPTASKFHDMNCGIADVPPRWFKALLIQLPEG